MAVSDKPWSQFSQADYTPEQWRRACLLDTGVGDPDNKNRYRLPVREPDGTLNRNGCHAAAGGHGVGQVEGVSADVKRQAARKLVALYRTDLNEDPPQSLLTLAGEGAASASTPTEEVRTAPFDVVDHDGWDFSGYAAVFGSPTRISGTREDFDEQINRGAFARTLRTVKPVLMFEHGRHPLIGSMPLGVIKTAREDDKGLYVEARLTDNWLIQPVRDAVANQAISGMSFRFTVPQGGDTWERDGRDVPLRSLNDIDCRELGPVVFPAYEPTSAQVRSMLDTLEFAGRSGARSTDGGMHGRTVTSNRARQRDRMLRIKGIISNG